MARKTKLTPDLQKKIIKLLEQGVSIEDTCSQVGITDRTYYNWQERGEATAKRLEENPDEADEPPADELPFFQFFQATTRGLKNAKVAAVGAVYRSIKGYKTKDTKTVVFKETRLRAAAEGGEEPYVYEKTTVTTTVAQRAPDPGTAIEYLKRRFPDEWSDRVRIDVDPALLKELTKLAANANVTLEALIRALVDELKTSDD